MREHIHALPYGAEIAAKEAYTNAVLYGAVYSNGVLENVTLQTVGQLSAGDVKTVKLTNQISVPRGKTVKFYLWDNTQKPLAEAKDNNHGESRTKIYIASDSLGARYNHKYDSNNVISNVGWGEILGRFMDVDRAEIVNRAVPGASTQSYYNNAVADAQMWNSFKDDISSGDYVLVSFGHNDSKTDEKTYTNPFGNESEEGSYKYYLNRFMTEINDKGGKMILVAPFSRQNGYSNDGQTYAYNVYDDGKVLLQYVKAMEEFATEHNIPFVNINRASIETKIASGNNLKEWYSDGTHFTPLGAENVAKAIATELGRIEGIGELVK